MSKTKTTLLAGLCTLSTIFNASSANAITRDAFITFFGPTQNLYSVQDNGERRNDLFGFPNDGLDTAVRLTPWDAEHAPDDFTLTFYDIVGEDLFARSSQETFIIRAGDFVSCANQTFSFSITPSYTDLMRKNISLEEARELFQQDFSLYMNNITWEVNSLNLIDQIESFALTFEIQHDITLRAREDWPKSVQPAPANAISPHCNTYQP